MSKRLSKRPRDIYLRTFCYASCGQTQNITYQAANIDAEVVDLFVKFKNACVGFI